MMFYSLWLLVKKINKNKKIINAILWHLCVISFIYSSWKTSAESEQLLYAPCKYVENKVKKGVSLATFISYVQV